MVRERGPGRYLPFAVMVTALLVAGPVVLARLAFPGDGLLNGLVAAAAVIVCSLALSAAAAAAWKRLPGSRDVMFSELMLWSWLRRYVAERRSRRRRLGITPAAERRRELAELMRLSRLMQANDPYLDGHSGRVARHAVRIARRLGLPGDEVRRIRTAAELHDVGKLETPREILHNPNRLSDEEYAVIKRHASRGAEMLDGITDPRIVAMVRHHHERIDGSGYPDGRAGDDIPLGARIIAVADTYDAITSARPYRRAAPHKRAIDVLGAESGKQLDAAAVTAFLAGYAGRRQLVAWSFVGVSMERAAYALKGLLATPALPILGASAVLATSPLLTHPFGRPAVRGTIPAARSSQRADADDVSHLTLRDFSTLPRTRTAHRGRPVPRSRQPVAYTPIPHTGTAVAPGSDGRTGAGGEGASAQTPVYTASPVEAGPPQSPSPRSSTPTVSVPSVTVPAVSTAVVETPAVETPAVTVTAAASPASPVSAPSVKISVGSLATLEVR